MFFSSCDSLVGDSLESIKQIEDPYMFDWENAIALHAMQGNRASSRGEGEVLSDCRRRPGMGPTLQRHPFSGLVDSGYNNQFCVPEVTSVFFSSCDSLVGDSLESIMQSEAPYVFDWENAIAMHAMQGNRASSRGEGEVSWIFSSCEIGRAHV